MSLMEVRALRASEMFKSCPKYSMTSHGHTEYRDDSDSVY